MTTKIENYLAKSAPAEVLPSESAKSAFLAENIDKRVTVLLWRVASDGARETFWTSVTLTPARAALVRCRLVDFA